MKKLVLFIAIAVLAFTNVNAQDSQFGLTAGYLNVDAKVKFDGTTVSASDSGFYIGALADFTVSETFHVQPELVYANVNESSALILPIMGKYYVSDSFNLQAGPQFTFSLEETPDDFSSIAIALGFGAGYDINENFFIEARYSFQLNNYYTGSEDLTAKENYLTFGIGYKFN